MRGVLRCGAYRALPTSSITPVPVPLVITQPSVQPTATAFARPSLNSIASRGSRSRSCAEPVRLT